MRRVLRRRRALYCAAISKDPHSRISHHASSTSRRYQVLKPEKTARRPMTWMRTTRFVTPLMGRAQPALWQEV
ncbi:hypothetical protein KCP71_20250 [Salmonella enterica subsp. enterica]|nr:hypothetical protein KCP71_20250 [Salmonella enterica subsp. enterica]